MNMRYNKLVARIRYTTTQITREEAMFKAFRSATRSPSTTKPKALNTPTTPSTARDEVLDLSGVVTELNKGEKFAALLDNVLAEEECQALIERSEQVGFEQALVNVGGGKQMKLDDVRNSHRCIIDDPDFAELLYQRIVSKLREDDHDPKILESILQWKRRGRQIRLDAVGCNERLRILKYRPGNYFKPHFDGCYVRRDEAGEIRRNEISMITILLYLNGGHKGGTTKFLPVDFQKTGCYDVVPRVGSVLMFEHDCYHEGAVLRSGLKYVLRTEIMYTTKGKGLEYSEGLYLSEKKEQT